MSSVDNRVVEMQFKNSQFESGIKTSISSLDKLKKALKLDKATQGLENVDKAAKKVSFSPLERAVETISNRFSTLGIIGVTALTNITNSAINAGKQLVSALTIDPIKTGFQEYETQINAVQTILANTASKGTNLQQVNQALDELNHYADMTIYNFTEMTRNIGTFTAAGVDLDTSVSAIKGIANLAAVSGSTSQQASTAMYQLSQALAAGTVKLMDWNSVVNAGMGGQVFQDSLKETARVHGIAIDDMIEKEGSFRETLSSGWLSSEILTETLAKFTGDLTEAQLQSMGYTDEQIKGIMEMGRTANDAATKVKTFTQLFDTLKEAAQSGWTQTWEILIGDFEEAKELLTSISDTVSEVINSSAEARNNLLQGWKDLGGRTVLIESFKNIFEAFSKIVSAIGDAFREIFPPATAEQLFSLTEGFKRFTETLKPSDATLNKIKETFKGFFSIVKAVIQVIGSLVKGFASVLSLIFPLGEGVLTITSGLGTLISRIFSSNSAFEILDKVISKVANAIKNFSSNLANMISNVDTTAFVNTVMDIFAKIKQVISNFFANGFDLNELARTFTTIFGTGVFAVISSNVAKFSGKIVESMSTIIDVIKGFGKNGDEEATGIAKLLDTVKGSLEDFQKTLRSSTLLKIAAAIGILAISLNTLSKIDSKDLAKALTATTVAFGELLAAFAVFSKVLSISDLAGIAQASFSMIALSTALLILSQAVKNLSKLNWDEIARGLAAVGGAMLELAIFTKISNFRGLALASVGIMAISTSMIILAGAMAIFATMDMDEIIRGLAAVGGLLAEIAIFSNFSGNIFRMLAMAKVLPVIAQSLIILSGALLILGKMSLDEIGKGLLALGGSLVILSIALDSMEDAIPGALAMAICASALMVIAPALRIMGGLSIKQLAIALTALAGTFIVFGIAGKALEGVAPSLLILSAAIGIFGIACLAVGAGMAAFASGLATLSVSGVAGATALTLVLQTLIGLIPALFKAVVDGILTAIKALADGIVGIKDSIVTIIKALCEVMRDSAYEIVDTVVYMIDLLLDTLLEHIPRFIDTGAKIILGILQGIADNIGPITETAIEIITNFINAITNQLPRLIQVGFDFITAFITGLANAVRQNGSKITAAIEDLFGSLFAAFALMAASLVVIQRAQTTIILMTAVVAALALIIKMLADLPVESVIGTAASLAVLLTSLSASALILQFVNPAGALAGVAGLAVVIAGIGALMVAIGALVTYVPQVQSFVNNAIPLLQAMGQGIGAFLGGIVGGIMEAASASLVTLGTNLSRFIGSIQPFIDGVQKIDDGAIRGVQSLAMMVLALAASDFINGINIFGSQGSSIQSLSENLPKLGQAMTEFANSIDPSIASSIQPSVEAAKALAEMMAVLPTDGGIFQLFTGSIDWDSLTTNLPKFGLALMSYGIAVAGLNTEAINASIEGAKGLIEVCNSIQASGGVFQFFTGTSDIASFAENLPIFGEALKKYGESVSDLNSNAIVSSLEAARGVVDVANSLQESGGVFSIFTGSNDLSEFAEKLPKFGEALKEYGEKVNGLNAYSIKNSAMAAQALVDISNSLGQSGGALSFFTGGQMDLNTFGSQLPYFGECLKKYSDKVNGINIGAINSSVSAAESLAEISNKLPQMGGLLGFLDGSNGNINTFASQLPNLGQAIKIYSEKVDGLNVAAINISVYAIEQLADISQKLPQCGGLLGFLDGSNGNINAFASQLPNLGQALKTYSDKVDGLNIAAVNISVSAAHQLADLSNKIPQWGGLLGFLDGSSGNIDSFSSQLPNLGHAIKLYSDKVDGINIAAVNISVYAIRQLADVSTVIPQMGGLLGFLDGSNGNISVFASQLPTLGQAIKTYSDKVDGIKIAPINISVNAVRQLAEVSKTIPQWGGLIGFLTGSSGGMDAFSSQLPTLGHAIKLYSEKVDGINIAAVNISVNAARQLAELSALIPSYGGLIGFLTGGSGGIDAFASQLPNLGQAIKTYSDKVSDINSSMIYASVNAGKQIVEFANQASGSSLSTSANIVSDGIKSFGEALKKFGEDVSGIDYGSIETSLYWFNQLKDAMQNFPNAIDTSGFTAFVEALNNAGVASVENFVNTLNQGAPRAREAATNMVRVAMQAAIQILVSYYPKFKSSGRLLITNLAQGMESAKNNVLVAVTRIMIETLLKIQSYESEYRQKGQTLGTAITDGMRIGIENGRSGVINAAVKTATDAYEAAKRALDSHSPSKKFINLGENSSLGLAIGMLAQSARVASAGESVVTTALDSVKDALSAMSTMIEDELDLNPTITPVLDSSNIRKGMAEVGSSFNVGYSGRRFSTAFKKIERSNASFFDEIQNGSGMQVINNYDMTQNNYSPKALNRSEIYRGTRNQFSRLKEMVNNK